MGNWVKQMRDKAAGEEEPEKRLTDMRELTRAEEQVMQVLWKIKKGFVKEILEHFEDPKPAYNTVSTIVRILQDKGFVTHKAYGRTHE